MSERPFLILIAGMSATGKTTFAAYLSEQLHIPMVSKDIIKERLYDTVGFKNRDEKVSLGVAAMDILYYFAEQHLLAGQPVILENNFENSSKPGLQRLVDRYQCEILTVYFHAELRTVHQRFLVRDRSPERHRGHVVNTQYPEVSGETQSIEARRVTAEEFYAAMQARGIVDFAPGSAMIRVDTTDFAAVNYERILGEVKREVAKFLTAH